MYENFNIKIFFKVKIKKFDTELVAFLIKVISNFLKPHKNLIKS